MEFKEYKSAEYWQMLRNQEKSCERTDDSYSAVAIVIISALFPILYCFASILDG